MHFNKHDTLLLVSRLIIGGIFMYAGYMKIATMDQTIAFFAQIGLPAFMAYLVAWVELLGGTLIVLGLKARYAALVIAVIMLGAAYYTRTGGMPTMGLPLALLGGLLGIVASGPGHYALSLKRRMLQTQ